MFELVWGLIRSLASFQVLEIGELNGMSSEWQESRGVRFDPKHPRFGNGPSFLNSPTKTRISIQHDDGFWCGELEGDTILESEYILLLTHLGRGQSDKSLRCANYIRQQQLAEGGWAIFPGGPLEISASVKSYFALKIVGDLADAEHMMRARNAILAAGGAEKVNSFTRFYLALLGVLTYEQCPAVPPEVVLLPKWMPFNIYEMSAWSRTIIVPLSLMWAFRPQTPVPPDQSIRELFVKSPEELPAHMPKCATLDPLQKKTLIDWEAFFRRVDSALKLIDRWKIRPLRQRRFGSDLSADHLEHRRIAVHGLRGRLPRSAVATDRTRSADDFGRGLRSFTALQVACLGHCHRDDRPARCGCPARASRDSAVCSMVVVARDSPSWRLGRARSKNGSGRLGV